MLVTYTLKHTYHSLVWIVLVSVCRRVYHDDLVLYSILEAIAIPILGCKLCCSTNRPLAMRECVAWFTFIVQRWKTPVDLCQPALPPCSGEKVPMLVFAQSEARTHMWRFSKTSRLGLSVTRNFYLPMWLKLFAWC